ncbi:hypothetical protein D3C85_864720 [compost metagenome]
MVDLLVHDIVAVNQHGTQSVLGGDAVAVDVIEVLPRTAQSIDVADQLTDLVVDVLASA